MSELPAGWAVAPLSAISTDADQCVPDADETFTYIDIGSIDRGAKSISSPQVLSGKDAPSRARKKVIAGDTLVSMTRPNLNAVALVPPALDGQIASTGFDVLRPLNGIDPRWLGYLVRSDDFVSSMSDLVQGALYPAVRAKDVREYLAPVAPSAEQTRIANQLDTLLARIKACNDHLDAIPGLLKRFRRAVINAATTGTLTEEWRSDTGKPLAVGADAGSANGTISAIALDLRYGTSKKCDYASTGVAVLRIPNIADHGRLDLSDLKFAEFDNKELAKLSLQEGDLLVIRSNGSLDLVGKTSVVTKAEAGLLFAGYLMRLRVDTAVADPAFIQLSLSGSSQRRYIEQMAKSTSGVNNLNAEELRALRFWLPDLAEQREIVNRVATLFEVADRIEANFSKARSRARRLTPQVLAKAFRGDLLPQDPNDEPASALLARLAAERNQAGAAPKSRKARAPRNARAVPSTSSPSKAMPSKSRQDEDVKGQPYLAAHLRRLGQPVDAKTLYEASELPVADFYKQLAWEIAEGHVNDADPLLEPARHAA